MSSDHNGKCAKNAKFLMKFLITFTYFIWVYQAWKQVDNIPYKK